MARLHNQLYRGTWSSALKNLVGDPKGEGGLERYGETLTPIVNLWGRAEFAYLREETLLADFLNSAAVAAEFSFVGWGVPLASGRIAVIEKVNCRTGAASAFLGHAPRSVVAATGTLAAGSALNRDTRFAKDPGVTIRGSGLERWTGSDPGATLGGNIEEIVSLAGANQPYTPALTPPYVLKPGAVLYVIGLTVNVSVQCNMSGFARNAFPGELGS